MTDLEAFREGVKDIEGLDFTENGFSYTTNKSPWDVVSAYTNKDNVTEVTYRNGAISIDIRYYISDPSISILPYGGIFIKGEKSTAEELREYINKLKDE